jgi:hypothetical protein
MWRHSSILVLTVAVFVIAGDGSQASVVDPNHMGGWAFNLTDSAGAAGTGTGTGDFVTGPDADNVPLGIGSAHFQTPSGGGNQSVQLRNSDWAGTALNALTTLSYSTYATDWNDQQLPYLTLYVDTDFDTVFDDRLIFEPTYSEGPSPGPERQNEWQTWDALHGMWYADSQGGPNSSLVFPLHDYAHFNDAVIVNPGLGGIRLASGFAEPTDNFNTNVDNFSIGTEVSTTYDFEPAETAEVPEATSIIVWTILISIVGGFCYCRVSVR